MSADPKPVELTEAERAMVRSAYYEDSITALYETAETIKAAARREALLEANKKHGYELARAWDECAEATSVCECSLGAHLVQPLNPYRAGLAEPERDEYEEQP